ncbi:MAG: hypothetical protein HYR63_16760 [Proteobacteria bacterium]|nr:hypothetical protein [Pseudomonadota bacterium]MBI3496564.1 hypothetical protein [Pseudomonadota bacterium]
MDYGWRYPRRKQFLLELQNNSSNKTHPVPFQGSNQYLPIHRLPLDLPLYRLENGRTTDRQAEYLAQHSDLPSDFFRADLESAEAQEVQHKLLVKLAKENDSKNLFAEFKKVEQSEPIILSAQGFVINGNRRLATWRDLYAEDSSAYKRFATIDVVILPPCDDRDLDALEATLQLKEDLKADYSWTAEALMYREKQTTHGYAEAQISALYEIDSQDLRELFDALDYADAYLESRGKPKRYSELDDKEFAFRQISRTRKKLKQPEPYKEIFEKASFCLADEAGEGKRTYAEIKVVGDVIEDVAENLIAELDLEAEEDKSEQLTRLADALNDQANFENARLAIRDTLDAEAAKKRHKKKTGYVADQIRRAREALQAAKEGIESGTLRDGCLPDLEQIGRLVAELSEWARGDGEQ